MFIIIITIIIREAESKTEKKQLIVTLILNILVPTHMSTIETQTEA